MGADVGPVWTEIGVVGVAHQVERFQSTYASFPPEYVMHMITNFLKVSMLWKISEAPKMW